MHTRTTFVTLTALVIALAGPPDHATVAATPLQGTTQQDEVAIALRDPGKHQKLGIPDFVVPAGDAELAAAAKTIADVLWSDIDFEREYYLIQRKSSAGIPLAPVTALPYDQWTTL